jgi:hypothetical protein
MRKAGDGPRWAGVKVPHAVPLAAAMCVAAFGLILYLARRFDFYYDEWDFVLGAPHWTLRDYFLPHNEHWSTLPSVIYKALFLTIGARSYLPFMGAVLLLHVATAFLLFLIIRRRSGDLLGLVAAAMLLFLGRGYENILWAFQVGFVGSIVFGLLAMYLLDTAAARRFVVVAASASLVISLTSSGIGLFFCGAIAVDLLLDPSRRKYLWVLIAPALAYALWYVRFGLQHAGVHRSPLSLTAIQQLVGYVPLGIGAAVAGLFSLSLNWSQLALALLTAALALMWHRAGKVDSRVLGAAAGLILQFALTGLVRAQFGDLQAGSPRYVYIGSVFLLLILTDAVRDLPWRGLWRPALATVVIVSVGWNAVHLRQAAASKDVQFAFQKAELRTVWLFRDAPGIDMNARIDPVLMPQVSAGAYLRSREELGSPLPDITLGGLQALDPHAVNQAMRDVMPIRVESTDPPGKISLCRSGSPGAGIDVTLAGGTTAVVRSSKPGEVKVSTWVMGDRPDAPGIVLQTGGDGSATIMVPDTGRAIAWHVYGQDPTAAAVVTVCSVGAT